MPYGRAKRAIPAKKTASGTVITGSMDSTSAPGATIDSAGIIASLDNIGSNLASQGAAAAAEYIPESMLRNITIASGDVLFISSNERYNNVNNNGKIIILTDASLTIIGILKNLGTVTIHNRGRLIT